MEQKSYKVDYRLEIVNELLKGPNHVRGIAKRLATNHMNISRKVKELSRENVVDYREEGKNKTYFLKKGAEARTYVFMAENYRLASTLGKYPELRRITERIQKDGRIKLAVLFGSYAKGLANPGSDIDIYVETGNREIKRDLGLAHTKLSVKIGKFDPDSLVAKEITKNHVIIKGAEEFYEKIRFFE